MEIDKYEEETRKQYQEYLEREHNGKLETKQYKKSPNRQNQKTRRNSYRVRGAKEPIGD